MKNHRVTSVRQREAKTISEEPQIFDYGNIIVGIINGKIHRIRPEVLMMHTFLARHYKGGDCTLDSCIGLDYSRQHLASVLTNVAMWNVPNLWGVIDHPVIRPDGTLFDSHGYDSETELYRTYYHSPEFDISLNPSLEDVEEAALTLWKPFRRIPFCTSVDRGVHLSALLTTVQRPVLPLAPAFVYSFQSQTTNSFMLAKAVGCLSDGISNNAVSFQNDHYEFSKVIHSSFMETRGAIIFDAFDGEQKSSLLSGFLSNKFFQRRIQSLNVSVDIPNTLMVLLTGNSVKIRGDLKNRVLLCRIDPSSGFSRQKLVKLVQSKRITLISAALTLLCGFRYHTRWKPLNRNSYFSDWSDLIRATVMWVGREKILDVSDPFKSLGNRNRLRG